MSGIAEQLDALEQDKSYIAAAITSKGVTVPQGSGFDNFASLIGNIPSGNAKLITGTYTPAVDTTIFEIEIPDNTKVKSCVVYANKNDINDALPDFGSTYAIISTQFSIDDTDYIGEAQSAGPTRWKEYATLHCVQTKSSGAYGSRDNTVNISVYEGGIYIEKNGVINTTTVAFGSMHSIVRYVGGVQYNYCIVCEM